MTQVALTLAHPLSVAKAKDLGITVEEGREADLPPGTEVVLGREYARSLMNVGYAAGVEPEKTSAVARALAAGAERAAEISAPAEDVKAVDAKAVDTAKTEAVKAPAAPVATAPLDSPKKG